MDSFSFRYIAELAAGAQEGWEELQLLDTLGELEEAKRRVESEEEEERRRPPQEREVSDQLNYYWPALAGDYAMTVPLHTSSCVDLSTLEVVVRPGKSIRKRVGKFLKQLFCCGWRQVGETRKVEEWEAANAHWE